MILQLSESFINAISWTVIHSVWQVSLLALCLAICKFYIPSRQSSIRYFLGLSAMGMSLIAGIATFTIYFLDWGTGSSGAEIFLTLESSEIFSPAFATEQGWTHILYDYSHIITQVWMAGVIILSIKLLIGYGYIQYLNHHSGIISNPILEFKLEKLKNKLGITSNIIIAETHKVVSPIVTGFIKPVILFPVGLTTHLQSEEIEAIIVHEIGHIIRNDWIINMFQSLLEIIFYYHPAMWWMSAYVKRERENCCDDYAIHHGYNRFTYARTLIKLKELEINDKPLLAMSFLNSKNALMNRIKRLLGQAPARNTIKEKVMALVLICTVAAAYAGTWVSKNNNINIPFLSNEKELKVELADSDFILRPSIISMNPDTIPGRKKSKSFTLRQNDGKSYKIESENGEIKRLEIDGKVIPPEEYDEYIDEIPNEGRWNYNFNHDFGDFPFKMDFEGFEMDEEQSRRLAESMERLSERLSRMDFEGLGDIEFRSFQLDSLMGQTWGRDGEHLERLNEMMERLGEMRLDELEGLHRLEELEGLEHLEGLERLKELEHMEGLERLKELEHLEGLENFNFNFPDFDGFNFNWENNINSKIGREMNEDGLLILDQENEIELTGKHLKVNGEKQPGNIHEKYKRIFEKGTGMELTDDSKVKFNVTGKETTRRIRRI